MCSFNRGHKKISFHSTTGQYLATFRDTARSLVINRRCHELTTVLRRFIASATLAYTSSPYFCFITISRFPRPPSASRRTKLSSRRQPGYRQSRRRHTQQTDVRCYFPAPCFCERCQVGLWHLAKGVIRYLPPSHTNSKVSHDERAWAKEKGTRVLVTVTMHIVNRNTKWKTIKWRWCWKKD